MPDWALPFVLGVALGLFVALVVLVLRGEVD